MAKHIVHCKICSQEMDINTLVEGIDWVQPNKPNGRYYHIRCRRDWAEQADDIKSIVTDDALWKDAAYWYFTRTLKIPCDYSKMISQWDRLIRKGRTSKGIYFAIRYFYEIEKGDRAKAAGGIGIVDYVYTRSCTYWADREFRGEHILEQIEQQIKEQQIQERIVIRKEKKKKKKINLEDVEALD